MKTQYLTVKETANVLDLCEQRVRAMLVQKKKHFPGARKSECGFRWMIPEKAVFEKAKELHGKEAPVSIQAMGAYYHHFYSPRKNNVK